MFGDSKNKNKNNQLKRNTEWEWGGASTDNKSLQIISRKEQETSSRWGNQLL